MSVVPAPERVADLALVRTLTTAKQGPDAKRLSADLAPLFDQRTGDGAWEERLAAAVRSAVDAGLLAARGKAYALTDAGRQRALAFLGVASLPARVQWKPHLLRHLAARALGSSLASPAVAKRVGDTKGLGIGGLILKHHHRLPLGEAPTLAQAVSALVCVRLDLDVNVNLLRSVPGPLKHLPGRAVAARNSSSEELVAATVRRWLAAPPATSPPPAAEPPAAFDLAAFASRAADAARTSPAGHFGDNKTFIAHVWRQFRDGQSGPPLTEEEFKRRLTEANHAGLLRLSRADLVEVMNPEDVRASETRYLNATFHFVEYQEPRP